MGGVMLGGEGETEELCCGVGVFVFCLGGLWRK